MRQTDLSSLRMQPYRPEFLHGYQRLPVCIPINWPVVWHKFCLYRNKRATPLPQEKPEVDRPPYIEAGRMTESFPGDGQENGIPI